VFCIFLFLSLGPNTSPIDKANRIREWSHTHMANGSLFKKTEK
jgi:hypothetical protein